MILVIDASVAFKWLVVEADSAEAIAWVGRTELLAPALIHSELANALWKRIRRGELNGEGAPEHLAYVDEVIRTVDETPFIPRALEIATELDHPVYDCVYLAMAESLGEQLLTADERFSRKLADSAFSGLVRGLVQ